MTEDRLKQLETEARATGLPCRTALELVLEIRRLRADIEFMSNCAKHGTALPHLTTMLRVAAERASQ